MQPITSSSVQDRSMVETTSGSIDNRKYMSHSLTGLITSVTIDLIRNGNMPEDVQSMASAFVFMSDYGIDCSEKSS